ncbi:MAG TPA: hypothetical protein PLI99_03585 [archaeon]|nr:hypothetical protein [archaeon]
MVNEQIMIDTVKRMIEAGIDDATIISTLSDAGLSNEQCLEIISRVKEPPVKEESINESVSPSSDISALRNAIEATSTAQDIQSESTSNILSEHENKILKVDNEIESIKSTISSSKGKEDGSLSYRISEFEKKLEEVNSASLAQLDLMKKILETNRKILTELEAKK